jgi:hypothetical protein
MALEAPGARRLPRDALHEGVAGGPVVAVVARREVGQHEAARAHAPSEARRHVRRGVPVGNGLGLRRRTSRALQLQSQFVNFKFTC